MRRLFVALLVLVAAVALAIYAQQDPGYVVVQFRGWTIEASLAITLAAVALTFVLLYFLTRFLLTTWRLPRHMRTWRRQRRERLALARLERGYIDLMEGRWDRAEKRLAPGAGVERGASDGSLLRYLGAARAAQELGAGERRDRYLRSATASKPEAEFAVALAQAEMHMGRSQYARATATLERLHGMAPKNRVVLTHLMRLRLQTGDWERLLELLPTLRKHDVIDEDRAGRLELRAGIGLLESPVLIDEQDLAAAWSRLPKPVKGREEVLRCYVRRLVERGANARAEAELREAIDHHWNPALVYLYALVEGIDPDRQLSHAEGWLRKHPGDAVLFLTLGRLCKRLGQWEKARRYFEACVQAGGTPEAFNELAVVLEELGDSNAALENYRRATAAMEVETQRLALHSSDARLPSPT